MSVLFFDRFTLTSTHFTIAWRYFSRRRLSVVAVKSNGETIILDLRASMLIMVVIAVIGELGWGIEFNRWIARRNQMLGDVFREAHAFLRLVLL